jgi:hypothetical protein
MIDDQRDPKRFRRYRDQLLERVYEAAQRERQRHGGHHLSSEFRDAIVRLEEFDSADAKTVVRV